MVFLMDPTIESFRVQESMGEIKEHLDKQWDDEKDKEVRWCGTKKSGHRLKAYEVTECYHKYAIHEKSNRIHMLRHYLLPKE